MRILFVAVWLALSGAVGLAVAQEPAVPPAGLAAEAAGDWDAAIAIYERTASESGRADLWVRISRIQATRDKPQEALDAIDRAVVLEPSNVEFLRARAELASWAGDYARAEDSHRRLGELTGDPAAELGLARIAAWRGRTAASIEHYHAYLRMQPADSVATIELARQETWRGNARGALDVLNGYRERFGETVDYQVERARALVTGGRPRAAIEILTPLVAEKPDDYEARLVQTLALSDSG
ncbi:MAG TPA: tetratricopeptide repeat protein, partial [Gemmatimonadota bacterium]|nr:tetratricopeptide repeat protein [Gemmatimonadota bacterium]